ncbi:unnamed protein product [Lampetra planeri]
MSAGLLAQHSVELLAGGKTSRASSFRREGFQMDLRRHLTFRRGTESHSGEQQQALERDDPRAPLRHVTNVSRRSARSNGLAARWRQDIKCVLAPKSRSRHASPGLRRPLRDKRHRRCSS